MIGWLDCASGVSGDMVLGALVDVGVPVEVLQQAVDAVTPEPVTLRAERTTRGALAATRVHVEGTDSTTHRTWADVRRLLETPSARTVPGIDRALATFAALAAAEAAVHGTTPEEVHFHEVGALDAIADVVAACAGFAHLGLTALHVSAVALGGGTVQAAHGRMSVPGPAVVRLLADAPSYGGPVDVELATPTGAALLVDPRDRVGPGAGDDRHPAGARCRRTRPGRSRQRAAAGGRRALDRRPARPRRPAPPWCWRPTSTTRTRGSGRPPSPPCWPPARRTPGSPRS